MDDKKISPLWMIPATLALWGLFGFTFYTIGSMLRGALL
jgi:hypothetical protein